MTIDTITLPVPDLRSYRRLDVSRQPSACRCPVGTRRVPSARPRGLRDRWALGQCR